MVWLVLIRYVYHSMYSRVASAAAAHEMKVIVPSAVYKCMDRGVIGNTHTFIDS